MLISGAITGARCLVTILTDGQGKNGSTVAVSVVMVTKLLMMMLLGYQYTVTTITSGSDIVQYNNLFSLVAVQPHPCIIIHDCVCSANGEA